MFAVLSVVVAAAASACGSSKSPTSPTEAATGGGGAVITGNIRAGSPLLAASTGAALSGLTVTVVGTTIASGVDATDHFTLTGVPPGDVDLKFSGAGVDSTVRLSQVSASQTVSLVVNVAGTSVVVDSELRSGAGSAEVEGRVESLPPTTAAGALVVAGKTITTDAATRFEQGGASKTFGDLLIGMRVHVEGTASGSAIRASVIRIQNTNTWIPVEINGVIDSLSGTASLFQFRIGSRLVKGDTLTVFFGDTSQSFATLKDGVRVEVKGQQRDGYVYAERLHVNDADADDEDDEDDDGQDDSASIHGALTSIAGAKPTLTLIVGGTTVRTSASTEVQRRGDVQTLDALKLGQTLHVVGVRQSNGSIDARRIQIDDDETGGEFEIEGSLGGLKGTCPALTFSVNGFSIATNGATVFEGAACAALKSGDKVKVNGKTQAGGSVLATRVKR